MYQIHLTMTTKVVNRQQADYSDTLPPGTYTAIEIDNPFNVPGRKECEKWLALVDKQHIGQCKDAWEKQPGVVIEVVAETKAA